MATIQEILVQHVKAHHQEGSDSIEQRIQLVEKGLKEWGLAQGMTKLSLSKSKKKSKKSVASKDDEELGDQVATALLHIYDCILLTSEINDDVEDVLELVVGIATSFEGLDTLLQRAQQALQAPLDRLRVLGCRLLRVTASNGDALIPRLTDKAQSVRLAAIQAGGAVLQSSSKEDGQDLLLEAMIWNMHHDSSLTNRMAALEAFQNLDDVSMAVDHAILRMRDVKPKVRIMAIETLHQANVLQDLTADQCAAIVRAGLTDRCKATSDATTVLICTRWIKAAKYDPLVLLTHLQPAVYEAECEKVIKTLLKVAAATGDYLKDLSDAEIRALVKGMTTLPDMADKLGPESLLVARLLCEHQTTERAKMDMLAKVLPDIPMLCEAIQTCLDKLAALVEQDEDSESEEEAQIFVCNQLFKLVQIMDLQEEGSRRHFSGACKSLLASIHTPEELLEEALKAMMHDVDYIESIGEVVHQMASSPVDDEETETQRLVQLRMVSILTIVLEHASPHATSLQSFSPHIIAAVTSEDVLIREAGVGCLGRLALLSDQATVLSEFKPLLSAIVSKEEETMEIRGQAMLALSDLTMLFSNVLSDDFVQVVASMLRSNNNPSVVAVAAEVATKLLFAGKVQDSDLVASLLVVFFNKAYNDYDEEEDDTQIGSIYRMQQLLSLFFPAYSMKTQQNKTVLVGAIRPMLTMITKKKRGRSPVWPLSKMIEFVYVTAEVGTEEQNGNANTKETKSTSQAVAVCLEVSGFLLDAHENLSSPHLRTLCKLLGGADVDVEESSKLLFELKTIVTELAMLITDENSLESLETMVELLEDVEEEAAEEEAVVEDGAEDGVDEDAGQEDDDETETEDEEEEELVEAMSKVDIQKGGSKNRREPLKRVN